MNCLKHLDRGKRSAIMGSHLEMEIEEDIVQRLEGETDLASMDQQTKVYLSSRTSMTR